MTEDWSYLYYTSQTFSGYWKWSNCVTGWHLATGFCVSYKWSEFNSWSEYPQYRCAYKIDLIDSK